MNQLNIKNRNRSYTAYEEAFLREAIEFSMHTNLKLSDMATQLSPLLGRTKKGIELKLGLMRQDMMNDHTPTTPAVRYLPRETKPSEETKPKTRETTSSIQQSKVSYSAPEVTHYEQLTEADNNKIYEVEVYNIKPYGAFCKTDDGKTGLLVKGLISSDHIEEVSDYLQIGDRFKARVMIDRQNPSRYMFNAKIIGNIIPLSKRS